MVFNLATLHVQLHAQSTNIHASGVYFAHGRFAL